MTLAWKPDLTIWMVCLAIAADVVVAAMLLYE